MTMSIILFLLFLIIIKPIHTAIQRLPSISLNEQSSIGTTIYDLTRIYPSSSKNLIKFSFLSDSTPHNSFFIIDSLTGRISIKRMIDREELCHTHICNCERCLLTLEIIASSQIIDILSLDIIIENINDNQPIFPVSLFEIRLLENTDIGHIVSFPSATDLDFHEILEYRIVSLNESNNQEILQTFSIINLQTENQLGLRLLKSLDRETKNIYQLKILASDGEHIGQLLLNIYILDSNDNVPKFEYEQYQLKLREDTLIGTDILHIHAYDNDEGLNALINYTIINDNLSSLFPFVINVTTGIIKLIQSLDYEYETNYHFNVRARDNGLDAISIYTQIQIDILDVNDCPPDIDFILPDNNNNFNENIFYIEEEKQINTRLFHLSVNDKDSINNKILLKLLTYKNLFQLNEQYNDLYNLIIIGRLDREEQEEYKLIFEAIDQGNELSLTTQKYIIISLIDINDSPPILDPFPIPININENNPPNIQLIQFHAKDLDAPNTSNSLVSYSILPSNDSRFFSIDSQTGILSVRNISFDYELKFFYYLILNISDHGINPKQLNTLQSLIIHINNINDNKPIFEQETYLFKLLENVSIGTLIGQIKAIDLDINSTIHYELTSINNQDVFYIDYLTGYLYTKALLDYETYPIYHLYITAKDNDDLHSIRVLVTIQLIDINDNSPIIDTPLSVHIPSKFLETNISKTILITTIIANDYDSGINGNLTYKIINGNLNNYFHINLYNGTITGKTNNLPQGYHRLIINVCDQGEYIEKCSTITLNIKIGEYIEKFFYSDQLIEDNNFITNDMIIIIIISSIFTLVFSITMGILCAFCCKQKRYHHIHRSSLKTPCELLQSTDADKLLSTNTFSSTSKNLTEHHHLGPYDDIKASGSAVSSEDSCYGSNDLSRSSSSAHGVTRPLLTPQHRSSSLSSTSVEYAVPTPRQQSSYNNKIANISIHQSIVHTDDNLQEQQSHNLKTFHSSAVSPSNHYNLKKTIQSLTRRSIVDCQSTYLTYDSIDIPPSPPNHSSTSPSSTTSTTSREYIILFEPPGSVNNSIRITEQSEMIQFKFGLLDLSVLLIEIYACAVAEASFLSIQKPKDSWREEMNKLLMILLQIN